MQSTLSHARSANKGINKQTVLIGTNSGHYSYPVQIHTHTHTHTHTHIQHTHTHNTHTHTLHHACTSHLQMVIYGADQEWRYQTLLHQSADLRGEGGVISVNRDGCV